MPHVFATGSDETAEGMGARVGHAAEKASLDLSELAASGGSAIGNLAIGLSSGFSRAVAGAACGAASAFGEFNKSIRQVAQGADSGFGEEARGVRSDADKAKSPVAVPAVSVAAQCRSGRK